MVLKAIYDKGTLRLLGNHQPKVGETIEVEIVEEDEATRKLREAGMLAEIPIDDIEGIDELLAMSDEEIDALLDNMIRTAPDDKTVEQLVDEDRGEY